VRRYRPNARWEELRHKWRSESSISSGCVGVSKRDLQWLFVAAGWARLIITSTWPKTSASVTTQEDDSSSLVCTATINEYFVNSTACYAIINAPSPMLSAYHTINDYMAPRAYVLIVVPSKLSNAVYIALPPLPFCAWKSMCLPSWSTSAPPGATRPFPSPVLKRGSLARV